MKHSLNLATTLTTLVFLTSTLLSATTLPVASQPPEIKILSQWNLKPIFPDWPAWQNATQELDQKLDKLLKLKGPIGENPAKLLQVLQNHDEAVALFYRIYQYFHLFSDSGTAIDQDIINTRWQIVDSLKAKTNNASNWIFPAIKELPYASIILWLDQNKELALYRFLLDNLFRLKPFQPSEKQQQLLQDFDPFFSTPANIYNKLTGDDFHPLSITLSTDKTTSETITMTPENFNRFITSTSIHQKNDLEKAFNAYFKSYQANKSTFIALFESVCQLQLGLAKVRGFRSTLEASLFIQNIPTHVYENLIKMARAGSKPLRRYILLRKKYFGLDEYHVYHDPIPLATPKRSFNNQTVIQWVLDASKVFGPGYEKRLKYIFNNGFTQFRSIHSLTNQSYTGYIYGVGPYARIDDTGSPFLPFELSQQMAYAIYLDYAGQNQPFPYADPHPLTRNVQARLNNRLMLHFILDKIPDPGTRAAFIDRTIRTIIQDYYMATMQTELEMNVHDTIRQGHPLAQEPLDKFIKEQFVSYFQDTIAYDDFLDIYWAQHRSIFLAPFSSYQDALAIAAATKLYRDLTNPEPSTREKTRENYLILLKNGGNNYPIDLLYQTGIDLTDPTTFLAVNQDLDDLINLLEIELEKMKYPGGSS